MNKNSIGLDIVYVEPCKNNIDWATPFFSDEYVHQKVRIIDNLDEFFAGEIPNEFGWYYHRKKWYCKSCYNDL